MAFFKFRQRGQPQPEASGRTGRKGGKEPAAAGPQETIDSMRRRARHRLVGAAVLVLLAVIGFPLLFDTQPRPVAVNAPITIPDKDKAAPLKIPEPVPANASLGEREEVVTAGTVAPPAAPVTPPARSLATGKPPAPARDARPDSAADNPAKADVAAQADEAARARAEQAAARARREEEARTQREDERAKAAQARRDEEQAQAKAKREQEARAKREAEQRAKREEAARARALLEGRGAAADKSADKPASAAADKAGRFVVQVGAFADDGAVREARQKAERAGVRTYTQVVDTKDGKRTRVRVGPFASREEADKAAAALKKAGLAGSILSL